MELDPELWRELTGGGPSFAEIAGRVLGRHRVAGTARLARIPLGLAAAREKATDALREVGKGQDPGQRKIEERRAETFSELAREYIERHASKKRSGRETSGS